MNIKNILNKVWIRAGTLKKESRKGSVVIEAILGCMTFIIVFCGVCDLIIMQNRNSTVIDTCKELTRTVSVQGGALENKPPSFASNYYTISDLVRMVKKNMDAAGFKDGEWDVTIKYTRVYDDATNTSQDLDADQTLIGFDDDGNIYYSPTLKIDYLSNFTIQMETKYSWYFLKSIMNTNDSILKITLPGTSEFKYNYDSWSSEN